MNKAARHFAIILLALTAVTICGCATAPIPVNVITQRTFDVVRVIDGDTFVIVYDGENTSCRIVGIDTPERREAGFEEATELLKRLFAESGGAVTISFPAKRKRDNFGRLLVDVTTDGGEDIAALMLESGMAEVYER